MDIHPILETNTTPNPNIWYVLSPEGDGPCIRVGHTCTFVSGDSRLVLIIGGANPDGSFGDVYVLNLDKFQWSCPDWKGLASRYEHSAFIPDCDSKKVFVFGGAQQATNMNDTQVLDLDKGEWTTVQTSGRPPSPRTCHSMASVGSRLYVFGGGLSGPEPVPDVTLHVFDTVDNSWSQPKVNGSPPSARHGHVSVVVGADIYIHGGMAGIDIFDDLHKLDIESHTWSKLQTSGTSPSPRTAHAAACTGKKIFVFGGMSSIGTALDDLYCLDTETLRWTRLHCEGPSPFPRLDHTLCTVQVPAPKDEGVPELVSNKDDLTMLLVFGGMDTQGQIFNDCLVLLTETPKPLK